VASLVVLEVATELVMVVVMGKSLLGLVLIVVTRLWFPLEAGRLDPPGRRCATVVCLRRPGGVDAPASTAGLVGSEDGAIPLDTQGW
jgi:hypothetical protein